VTKQTFCAEKATFVTGISYSNTVAGCWTGGCQKYAS